MIDGERIGTAWENTITSGDFMFREPGEVIIYKRNCRSSLKSRIFKRVLSVCCRSNSESFFELFFKVSSIFKAAVFSDFGDLQISI